MQKTTNLQLNKLELADSPPDITVLNANWDKLESEIYPTLDVATVPTGNQGFLKALLGGIANRIKAITGKTNWWDAPATTIENLNTNSISKTLVTAVNDFIVGTAASTVAKKTLAETKIILGISTASETVAGQVELATAAEVTAGTDNTRAVTPAGLKVELDKKALASDLADMTYQLATGTAIAIIVTMPTLTNGYAKTFIASANNNGSATTINAKNLYKPGTTTAPTLIAGKAYTVWYNTTGNCFFIKASAEGDVVASQVLAGKKFSNDSDTGLVGTMIDRKDNWQLSDSIYGYNDGSTGRLLLRPPIGYYNGLGETKVFADDVNYHSSNILSGKSIFGLAGGIPIAPNYPDNNSASACDVYPSLPNSRHNLFLKVPKGYYDETWMGVYLASLIPTNVLSGVVIGSGGMGLAGTAKRTARGSVVSNGSFIDVGGLNFTPKIITMTQRNWAYGDTITYDAYNNPGKVSYTYSSTVTTISASAMWINGSGFHINSAVNGVTYDWSASE